MYHEIYDALKAAGFIRKGKEKRSKTLESQQWIGPKTDTMDLLCTVPVGDVPRPRTSSMALFQQC